MYASSRNIVTISFQKYVFCEYGVNKAMDYVLGAHLLYDIYEILGSAVYN